MIYKKKNIYIFRIAKVIIILNTEVLTISTEKYRHVIDNYSQNLNEYSNT